MTEVSVENKGREKCLEKERTRKDLLVTGFTQFKALLLFCKQHYKYFTIAMQYYVVSVTNLSNLIYFYTQHQSLRSQTTQLRHKGLKCKHLRKLSTISHFTLIGLPGFRNRLEHVHNPEHIHVVEGLRLHWIADFKGFKGLLSLPLIGLKFRSHFQLPTLSGSIQKGEIHKLTFIFWKWSVSSGNATKLCQNFMDGHIINTITTCLWNSGFVLC